MLVTQGNFIIILGATPQCLWKGAEITGVTKISVKYHDTAAISKLVIKLTIRGTQTEIYNELIAAGISIEKERL